jgi:hypothetical protein
MSKIVHFPPATPHRGIQRITGYRPSTWAEMGIAIWLSGWALLTAVECGRQIGRSTDPNVRPAQTTEARIYLAGASVSGAGSTDKSPSPPKDCNFSRPDGVLHLN